MAIAEARTAAGAAPEEHARVRIHSLPGLFREFGRHYRPYRGMLAAGFACMFATVAVAALMPWPIKLILDYVILGRPLPERFAFLESLFADRAAILAILALGIVVLAVLQAVLSYFDKLWISFTGDRIAADIRERVFSHLQRLSLSFHDSARSGDLVYRLMSDAPRMKNLLVDFPRDLSLRVVTLLLYAGLMLALDLRLGLIALAALPLIAACTRIFDSRMKAAARRAREQHGTAAAIAGDTLTAIEVVQAYGQERSERERFERQSDETLFAQLHAVRLQRTYGRVVDFLVTLSAAGVLFEGGRRALAGEVLPGTLVIYMAYVRELYGSFDKFSALFLNLARSQACAERLVDLVDSDLIDRDSPEARDPESARGHVEFRDVTFAYRQGPPVLRGVSFVAEPGQTVAIVGDSGAGKSTLISLLLRLHDPQRGSIRLDGEDVKDLTRRGLRAQMTVVLQDARLFNQSVADNIAFGRVGCTREEVIEAARLAEAHDFISRLPEGYETVLAESGDDLSGGQRQRIHIARALVRDTPIVVLDEPGTSLDAEAEARVQSAVRHLAEGRTTFVVAHRLATLMHADRILILEDGRIAGQGTHEELRHASAAYRELCRLQFGEVPVGVNGVAGDPLHAMRTNGGAA